MKVINGNFKIVTLIRRSGLDTKAGHRTRLLENYVYYSLEQVVTFT